MSIITTKGLIKRYKVTSKDPGLLAGLRSVFKPTFEERIALNAVDITIERGEIVGILGPNGAGKTTLMKILSGILYPTEGFCEVLGFKPWKRHTSFQKRIAIVMGQKNTLWWDLPASDSFILLQEIYQLDPLTTKKRVSMLSERLGVENLLISPVRNLSLGERMKMEIIAGLIHSPEVLFLDEPSIGLDVTSQRAIREFIKEENLVNGITVLLTSHYMQDIEELCERVAIVDKGSIIYDGHLRKLTSSVNNSKIARITFSSEQTPNLKDIGVVLETKDGEITVEVDRSNIPKLISRLSALHVLDFTLKDPPIERTIESIFSNGLGSQSEHSR